MIISSSRSGVSSVHNSQVAIHSSQSKTPNLYFIIIIIFALLWCERQIKVIKNCPRKKSPVHRLGKKIVSKINANIHFFPFTQRKKCC
jgi:hypothetical protein